MRVSAFLGSALLVVVGARAVGACDEETSHLLIGQLFDPARACLDPEGTIALVDGPVPQSACPPTCVVGPSGQNGNASSVYVTTMCGPYPELDDTSGDPAGCSDALTALARGDTCLIDGGSSSPASTNDDAGDGNTTRDGGKRDARAD